MLPPVALSLPGAAPELPFEKIALQLVALRALQPRKAGAQIAHHIVEGPAALDDLIGTGDERGQGLCHQVRARGRKKRHAVVAKHALERAAVVLKAAHDKGDIPPAAAPVPHEGEAEGRGLFAFGGHTRGPDEAQGGRALPVRVRIVKKVLGKKAQGVVVPLALEARERRLLPQLLRCGGKRARGPAGELKDFALAVEIVHRQAYGQAEALPQHGAEDLLLLAREVDKAVHIDPGAPVKAAAVDGPGKPCEPVGGVRPAVCDHALIGLEHQGQVLQLVAQGVRAGGRRLREHFSVDACGLELVHRLQQHSLHLGPALGRAVDLQPRAHPLQGQRHAEHAPALVEPGRRRAAAFGLEAAGKTREAQYLGIEGETVPAGTAELPLGLMAVLLGHEQDAALFPALHILPDAADQRRGLSRARPADQKFQHRTLTSLVPCFVHCSKWGRGRQERVWALHS